MMGPSIKFVETLKKKNGTSRALAAAALSLALKIIFFAYLADARWDTTIERQGT